MVYYVSFLDLVHGAFALVLIITPQVVRYSGWRLSCLSMVQIVDVNFLLDLSKGWGSASSLDARHLIIRYKFKILAEDDRYEKVGQNCNVLLFLGLSDFI